MAITYKFLKISESAGNEFVIKTDDQGNKYTIPFNKDNIDYQEYLKWVDAGNTASASD